MKNYQITAQIERDKETSCQRNCSLVIKRNLITFGAKVIRYNLRFQATVAPILQSCAIDLG